jgi:hypothetical protein
VEELNPDLDLPQHLLPRAIETFLQLPAPPGRSSGGN